MESLEHRYEMEQRRQQLEDQARVANDAGDRPKAERLWRSALELARQSDDEFAVWFVEGQLGELLIESGRVSEATTLLEASLASGSDIPLALSLLVGLYREVRAYEQVARVLRYSWGRSIERSARCGGEPPDPFWQLVGLAKEWKDAGSELPISLAEQWALEAKHQQALFAVRHERSQWLEKQDDTAAALELYLDLIRQGTKYEATFTRALILLERAKRFEEAVTLARSICTMGLSASIEEQARKRIARLEAKAISPRSGNRSKKLPSQPKKLIPAFSIRTGGKSLKWVGQVELKGGAKSVLIVPSGVLVTRGADLGLWWIADGTVEPRLLRPAPTAGRLYLGNRTALIVTNEGNVASGSARVEIVDDDWTTIVTQQLPGVATKVAILDWGFAVGCRNGALYAIGQEGSLLWQFHVPSGPDARPFGRLCPYLVSGLLTAGSVVFSSYKDVYALTEGARLAWKWCLPDVEPISIGSGVAVTLGLPGPYVAAVQATREGGAWVASQAGELYRLDARGQVVTSLETGRNTSQFLTDDEGQLVAFAQSGSIAFVRADGGGTRIFKMDSWPQLHRSADGMIVLATEGKMLRIFRPGGELVSLVEFSRTIDAAGFVGSRIVVAANKIVAFEIA